MRQVTVALRQVGDLGNYLSIVEEQASRLGLQPGGSAAALQQPAAGAGDGSGDKA